MSVVPTCVVCDQRVASIYAPDALCERCKLPCPTCGGVVGFCSHALPILDLDPKELPNGRYQVAA